MAVGWRKGKKGRATAGRTQATCQVARGGRWGSRHTTSPSMDLAQSVNLAYVYITPPALLVALAASPLSLTFLAISRHTLAFPSASTSSPLSSLLVPPPLSLPPSHSHTYQSLSQTAHLPTIQPAMASFKANPSNLLYKLSAFAALLVALILLSGAPSTTNAQQKEDVSSPSLF